MLCTGLNIDILVKMELAKQILGLSKVASSKDWLNYGDPRSSGLVVRDQIHNVLEIDTSWNFKGRAGLNIDILVKMEVAKQILGL